MWKAKRQHLSGISPSGKGEAVTLQPSDDDAPAVQETKKIRPLLAWGLLGVNALWLLIILEAFLFPGDGARDTFSARALYAFGEQSAIVTDQNGGAGFPGTLSLGFVGILQITLPLLAVLLITHIRPVVPNAKPFLLTALIEYGVSALFGLIAFIATFTIDGNGLGRMLTESAFFRVGLFALLGMAGFVVWKAAAPYFVRPTGYGPNAYNAFGQPGGPPQGWPQQPGPWSGQPPQQQGFGGPGGPPQGWPQQPAQHQLGPGQGGGQSGAGQPGAWPMAQQGQGQPGQQPAPYPAPGQQSMLPPAPQSGPPVPGQPGQQNLANPTAVWPQQPPMWPSPSPPVQSTPPPNEDDDQSTQFVSPEQRQALEAQQGNPGTPPGNGPQGAPGWPPPPPSQQPDQGQQD